MKTQEGCTGLGKMIEHMGLFNIFKKAEAEKTAPDTAQKGGEGADNDPVTKLAESDVQEREPEGYDGDLEKTHQLAKLVAVAIAERDEIWVDQFLSCLPFASLKPGNPQLIAGPDGFPYFQLFTPAPGEEFQSFIVEKMIPDFLVERGYGVVLNPGAGQPDWVLTYGDILNYYLNGTFFTMDSNFSSSTDAEEIVSEGEEILIGQPSESILPLPTRKLLKDFFELNGIQDPKVLLMMRKNGDEVASQDLAFNITPEGFESEAHYRNMMQTVTWYLPRHYSLVGLSDTHVEHGFMSL